MSGPVAFPTLCPSGTVVIIVIFKLVIIVADACIILLMHQTLF